MLNKERQRPWNWTHYVRTDTTVRDRFDFMLPYRTSLEVSNMDLMTGLGCSTISEHPDFGLIPLYVISSNVDTYVKFVHHLEIVSGENLQFIIDTIMWLRLWGPRRC